MAEMNYQADVNDQEQSFEPVPAGEYLVAIEESDYLENKQGTGKYLKLKYTILDGPMKNRKLFEQLNLENKSAQAETIARQALNSICVACGVVRIQDSAELHGIPFMVKVAMKNDPDYGLRNAIRKHFAINGKAPAAPAGDSSDEKPKAADAKKKKHPWEK